MAFLLRHGVIDEARLDILAPAGAISRRPHVHDGVPLHIVQHGHNRKPCFFDEEDYFCYLHWLKEALAENACALHAYALMTNHVHLLLTPQKADAVPDLMMSIGLRYAQYIDRVYRRAGTLWESRYQSSPVRAEAGLLDCQRHIELNPVRAAMVKDPALYRWTSYRANALGYEDAGVTPHALYLSLGQDAEARRRSYRGLFRSEPDTEAVADMRLALS